jgi:large subunit ribosomal protein LP2
MRHVAAYLLAVLGGKASPSAADLKKILTSVGVEANANSLDVVIKSLKGKSVSELIEEGQALLANVPSGGGGAAASSGEAAGIVEEEKPKEKTPEPESESDEDMGLGLFD